MRHRRSPALRRARRSPFVVAVCCAGLLAFAPSASAQGVISVLGSLPLGVVGFGYTASLKISGGTPPYTLVQQWGTLPFVGIDISVRDITRLAFQGSPTKAGAWWWKGLLEDADKNRSVVGVEETEFVDSSKTIASVIHALPIYYDFTKPCCRFQANVEPAHTASGAPYGTVIFTVAERGLPGKKDYDEGSAQISPYDFIPGPQRTPTVQGTTRVGAGDWTLTARYDTPTVPNSITGLQGFTRNPYNPSSGSVDFDVLSAPTETDLEEPEVTKTRVGTFALTFTVEVENDTGVTGGSAQVDPGTDIVLFDGMVQRGTEPVPSNGTTAQFVISAMPGWHTFYAKYGGDANERKSVSGNVKLDLK